MAKNGRGNFLGTQVIAPGGVGHQYNFALPAVAWPVRIGAPPLTAAAFQLRESEVELDDNAGSSTEGDTILLVGDGGVGKTQIAAHQFRKFQGDLKIWANGETAHGLQSVFHRAAVALQLASESSTDPTANALKFLDWLSTTERSWLVVIDDLWLDSDQMRALWPQGGGRTIVTTRYRGPGYLHSGCRQVDVGTFSLNEARTYFQTRLSESKGIHLADGVERLVGLLGGLPVALSQAAALMLEQQLTALDYIRKFEDERSRLESLFPTALRGDYRFTAATTWAVSLSFARQTPATDAMARMLSLLNPNGVPDALWKTQDVLKYLNESGLPAEEDPNLPLGVLQRYSLIQRDRTSVGRETRIHSLAQRAIRESPGDANGAIRAVRGGLHELLINGHAEHADSQLSLRQNIRSFLDSSPSRIVWNQLGDEQALKNAYELVSAAVDRGDPVGSSHLWTTHGDELLELAHAESGAALRIRFEIALWHGESGSIHEAAREFEQLLSDVRDQHLPDFRFRVDVRYNYARWLGRSGSVESAIGQMGVVIRLRRRVLGAKHPDTLVAVSRQAFWIGNHGDEREAIAILARTIPELENALGQDHEEVLYARNIHAWWLGRCGEAKAARPLLDRLYQDSVRIRGASHSETLTVLSNLAVMRGEDGDPKAAVETFRGLLEARERLLGPLHPNTLINRGNLASWTGRAGDPKAAARAFGQLVAMEQDKFGERHPDTLNARHNLATWTAKAGDVQEALDMLEELIPLNVRVLGELHPTTLASKYRHACCLVEVERAGEARDSLKKLLPKVSKMLGADHPRTRQFQILLDEIDN